jgi:hypothetical protein
MSEEEQYDLGYFEGVRNVFMLWQRCLVRYEAEGAVELQLNSELFLAEMTKELEEANTCLEETRKYLREENE